MAGIWIWILIFLMTITPFQNENWASNDLRHMITTDGFALGHATTASQDNLLGNIIKNPATLSHLNEETLKTSYSSLFESAYSGFELGYGNTISEELSFGILIPMKLISNIPNTINLGGRRRLFWKIS